MIQKSTKNRNSDTTKIYMNGNIYTGGEKSKWLEAVVTKGNKIIFTGDKKSALLYKKKNTNVVDLQGKLMLPGFIDSHMHLLNGGFQILEADFGGIKTKQKFQQKLAALKPHRGEWILGGNLDMNLFTDNISPDKTWIDEIVAEDPVFIACRDLHSCIVNSAALNLSGINESIKNPEDGVIGKYSDRNELNGILLESAEELVKKQIPQPTKEEIRLALKKGLEYIKQFGITSVHDIGTPELFDLYEILNVNSESTCRINTIFPIEKISDEKLLDNYISRGSDFLKFGTFKVFADGSLGSGTAWFFEEYTDQKSNFGLPGKSIMHGNLKSLLSLVSQKGLQAAVHAIGNRAVSEVISIFEQIKPLKNIKKYRWRIEHLQHIRVEDIKRLNVLGVIASMQPLHLTADITLCERKLGKDRFAGSYAFRSLLDNDIKLCFGSDWNVVPPDVLKGIYAAVTRNANKNIYKNGWMPEEKISVEEAVKAYTINGAYASHEESKKGSIEIGKAADFVILSDNIFAIPVEELVDTNVLMTILDGDVIYENW